VSQTTSVRVSPFQTAVDRATDRLLDTPTRYWVLAVLSGGLVYAAMRETRWVPFASLHNDEAIAFAGGLVQLVAIMLALAPLVATRWVLAATTLCVAPLLLSVVSDNQWPFSVFVALLAVSAVGTWRSPGRALVPAVAAVLLVVTLVTSASTLLMPYGAEVYFGYGGNGFLDRGLPLLLYVVATASAYGLGMWMRSSQLRATRLAGLTARAGEVESHAVAVGERARLAHDLHDVVAHHVSLIAVRAETAPYAHPDLSVEAKQLLAAIATDARSALLELRGVLGVLRRAEDDGAERSPQPTLSDLPALVEKARAAGDAVTLRLEPSDWAGLGTGHVAYRVVQEALTNARRHAPGLPVHVIVSPEVSRLLVRVTNPYVAEGPSTVEDGHGLVGMRERVEGIGGSLAAGVQGDLFVVEADLPRGLPDEEPA
jgi:signal transduction histidine kinase